MEYPFKDLAILRVISKLPWLLIALLFLITLCTLLTILLLSARREVVPLPISDTETLIVEDPDKITIDLAGSVVNPGLYTLDKGSRVGDLLEISGGLGPNAAHAWVSHNMNLSTLLEDTHKIYIPYEWEIYESTQSLSANNDPCKDHFLDEHIPTITLSPSVRIPSPVPDDSSGNLDVNTATLAELDALPGIGPAYAAKIISFKPYDSFEDLVSRSGVPETTLNKLKGLLSFEK